MKARPSRSKKRTLHQTPPEMARAKRIHATVWWQREMEDERRRHEPERQVGYKQPRRPKKGPGLVR